VREPGPYLLNVKVSPYENVYPMVPAGGAINEMVLGQPKPFRWRATIPLPHGVAGTSRARKQAVGDNKCYKLFTVTREQTRALMRVTGLLSARGYNIESLTVARTTDPNCRG
jgi:hypothetical protein